MSPSATPTPEVARRKRVTRALSNPVYFAEQYVRPYDPFWVTPTPDFGAEMLAFALGRKKAIIQLPPEFMKTTLLSQVLPTWLTLDATIHGRLLRGLLWSEEERMAIGNLNVIKWHLIDNERIASDFCDERGRPLIYPDPEEDTWREDSIVVARSTPSKDPTWQAKGLDSKGITGRRLDWVIGDDVITLTNATSPALRKKALDVMELVIENRVVRTGHMVMAGNFNDAKDLLSSLAKRTDWDHFHRPAISRPGQPHLAARESELMTGDLLWPENWDRRRLLDKYEARPNRFRRTYLMDSRAEHGERLNVGWVTLIEPEETPLRYAKFYISFDDAPGGETEDLDFFNVSVLALSDLYIDLVESHDVRAKLPDRQKLLGVMHDRYARLGSGVIAIGGAKQTLDRGFADSFKIMRKDLGHKLHEIPVVDSAKEQRIEGLGAYAQSGWMRIWKPVWTAQTSGADDRDEELSLFEQWRDFPYGKHDDKLDGLHMGIATAEDLALVGGDSEHELAVAGD